MVQIPTLYGARKIGTCGVLAPIYYNFRIYIRHVGILYSINTSTAARHGEGTHFNFTRPPLIYSQLFSFSPFSAISIFLRSAYLCRYGAQYTCALHAYDRTIRRYIGIRVISRRRRFSFSALCTHTCLNTANDIILGVRVQYTRVVGVW